MIFVNKSHHFRTQEFKPLFEWARDYVFDDVHASAPPFTAYLADNRQKFTAKGLMKEYPQAYIIVYLGSQIKFPYEWKNPAKYGRRVFVYNNIQELCVAIAIHEMWHVKQYADPSAPVDPGARKLIARLRPGLAHALNVTQHILYARGKPFEIDAAYHEDLGVKEFIRQQDAEDPRVKEEPKFLGVRAKSQPIRYRNVGPKIESERIAYRVRGLLNKQNVHTYIRRMWAKDVSDEGVTWKIVYQLQTKTDLKTARNLSRMIAAYVDELKAREAEIAGEGPAPFSAPAFRIADQSEND